MANQPCSTSVPTRGDTVLGFLTSQVDAQEVPTLCFLARMLDEESHGTAPRTDHTDVVRATSRPAPHALRFLLQHEHRSAHDLQTLHLLQSLLDEDAEHAMAHDGAEDADLTEDVVMVGDKPAVPLLPPPVPDTPQVNTAAVVVGDVQRPVTPERGAVCALQPTTPTSPKSTPAAHPWEAGRRPRRISRELLTQLRAQLQARRTPSKLDAVHATEAAARPVQDRSEVVAQVRRSFVERYMENLYGRGKGHGRANLLRVRREVCAAHTAEPPLRPPSRPALEHTTPDEAPPRSQPTTRSDSQVTPRRTSRRVASAFLHDYRVSTQTPRGGDDAVAVGRLPSSALDQPLDRRSSRRALGHPPAAHAVVPVRATATPPAPFAKLVASPPQARRRSAAQMRQRGRPPSALQPAALQPSLDLAIVGTPIQMARSQPRRPSSAMRR